MSCLEEIRKLYDVDTVYYPSLLVIYVCIVEIAILSIFLNTTNVSLNQNIGTRLCFRLKRSSLLQLTALLV